MKNSFDTIKNQTCDLPACNAVPQPTVPLRTPTWHSKNLFVFSSKFVPLHIFSIQSIVVDFAEVEVNIPTCSTLGRQWLLCAAYFVDCIAFKCCVYCFCTMTSKCTNISQIITLLHVSTLSCHPQGACNLYLIKLHKYFKCSCYAFDILV